MNISDFLGKNVIFQYLRERRNGRKNQRVGILLAVKSYKDGEVYIGFSKCHEKEKFNLLDGLKMAEFRALDKSKNPKLPLKHARELDNFVRRSMRYFKTDDVFYYPTVANCEDGNKLYTECHKCKDDNIRNSIDKEELAVDMAKRKLIKKFGRFNELLYVNFIMCINKLEKSIVNVEERIDKIDKRENVDNIDSLNLLAELITRVKNLEEMHDIKAEGDKAKGDKAKGDKADCKYIIKHNDKYANKYLEDEVIGTYTNDLDKAKKYVTLKDARDAIEKGGMSGYEEVVKVKSVSVNDKWEII